MDTVVQDSSAVCQFSEITIQNDAGKCHMKFSGHLWEQEVQSSSLCTPTKTAVFYAKQRFFATFLKFIRTSVLVIILAFVESAKLYNILAQEVNEMG